MFRLAKALLANGLRKQERVAVLSRNCSEYVECFGAGEVGGFVTINLNSQLAPWIPRSASILKADFIFDTFKNIRPSFAGYLKTQTAHKIRKGRRSRL